MSAGGDDDYLDDKFLLQAEKDAPPHIRDPKLRRPPPPKQLSKKEMVHSFVCCDWREMGAYLLAANDSLSICSSSSFLFSAVSSLPSCCRMLHTLVNWRF